jgi:NDP-sugar pyrophosphorylase family protein
MRALVMAGGEGRRLNPLTRDTPKPLLLVSGKPILDHLLQHLQRFGVDRVTVAVAHLAPKIKAYFGTGAERGMSISYLHESIPLGTAGALARLDHFDEPILMLNGDILTDLDFTELVTEHRTRNATLTVASKIMHTNLTLGVLDLDESGLVAAYREKPRLEHRVGIGIYVVNPEVKDFIPDNKPLDMPSLINTLIARGKTVAGYDHSGNWIDIGTPEEYARAEENHWLGNALGA